MKTQIINQNILRKIWFKIYNTRYFPSDKTYDFTFSKEKKFIWYHVPKVGYTTITHILTRPGVCSDINQVYGQFYAPYVFKDYYKFGFVRNPWDRFISCWRNKIFRENYFKLPESERNKMKELHNFINFVSSMDLTSCDAHVKYQSKLINMNHVDFLGRFENFSDDLTIICKKLNLNFVEIPVTNKSDRAISYKEYFNNDTASQIARLYESDIRIFGYTY